MNVLVCTINVLMENLGLLTTALCNSATFLVEADCSNVMVWNWKVPHRLAVGDVIFNNAAGPGWVVLYFYTFEPVGGR